MDKAEAFAEKCRVILTEGKGTHKGIASLRGKLSWWRPALMHSELLSRALTTMTAGEELQHKWTKVIPLTEEAKQELQY